MAKNMNSNGKSIAVTTALAVTTAQQWARELRYKRANTMMAGIKEILDFVNRFSWKKIEIQRPPLNLLLVKNPKFHHSMENINPDISPVINISFAPRLKAYYFYSNLFKYSVLFKTSSLPFSGLRRPGDESMAQGAGRTAYGAKHLTRKNFLLRGFGDVGHEYYHRKNYPFPEFLDRFLVTDPGTAPGSITNHIYSTNRLIEKVYKYNKEYGKIPITGFLEKQRLLDLELKSIVPIEGPSFALRAAGNQVVQQIYERLITHFSSLQYTAASEIVPVLKPVLNRIYAMNRPVENVFKISRISHTPHVLHVSPGNRPNVNSPTGTGLPGGISLRQLHRFHQPPQPQEPDQHNDHDQVLGDRSLKPVPIDTASNRIYTMNRLMENVFKSTSSTSHLSPISHISPVSLVLQKPRFIEGSPSASGHPSILSRIFTYAYPGNIPGYKYTYPGDRFIQHIYKRIPTLFSSLQYSTALLPKKEVHFPDRKPLDSDIHIHPFGKSTSRTHRHMNQHRYSPPYAAGLPPTPLEMVIKKINRDDKQINLEEMEKTIYQKVSKQVEQTIHKKINQRMAFTSQETHWLTENIYSRLVNRIVLEKERLI